jgi:hypothetical protein
LERAVEREPNIYLPDLLEKFFKDLLSRESTLEYIKLVLLAEFYDFIDVLVGRDEVLLSRIIEEDTKSFFEKANQEVPSLEAIKVRLPKEYRDLATIFIP